MSIDTDYHVLRRVLSEQEISGWAIEFGVYTGYSIRIIAEHMPVIGLDSFAGLPEDWRPGFPKGKFDDKNSLRYLRAGPHPNIMLVGGLFENTLPRLVEHGLPPLGLVHIDCDLYSSTVTALNGVLPFISPGTVFVFDEMKGYEGWEDHEAKAWSEFIDRHKVKGECIAWGAEEMAFRIESIG